LAAAKPPEGLEFEVPEVEIVRRELERDIINRKVRLVEAASMKCLSRYRARKFFYEALQGVKITGIRRVGVYLILELDNEHLLVMSLGYSGLPRRTPNKHPKLPNTEVVISFTQYGQLRFVDAHGGGDLFVIPAELLEETLPKITGYGIDPVASTVSWTDMGRKILQRKGKLKAVLTDDTFVVGIGNIYADEILFEAGLRFDRPCSSLSAQEIRRLHRSLVGTLHEAVKYRGTSVPERPFFDPSGQAGVYANHLKVWGRHGQLSERSRTPIKRVKFRNVWTYYCDTQV